VPHRARSRVRRQPPAQPVELVLGGVLAAAVAAYITLRLYVRL
jgi:hypothetical protein